MIPIDAPLLDDEAALRERDPSGFVEAVLSLPRQLREGYEAGRAVDVPGAGRPKAVVFGGMGGSAAAADVLVDGSPRLSTVPMLVVRGERLPDFVDERTMVVVLSYSGETDEALWIADDAAGRGARLVTIASGGRLARPRNGSSVVVPASAPVPRAALGLLTGAALGVMERSGIAFGPEDPDPSHKVQVPGDGDWLGDEPELIARWLEKLAPPSPVKANPAKQLAVWLDDRIPVVWGSVPSTGSVAWRWKAAFNENAKMPAFASALPELAHHEVVGWTKGWADPFAVIPLRSSDEARTDEEGIRRTESRLAGALELLDDAGVPHRQAHAPEGMAGWGEHLALMALGDLTSAYHALARGIDPTPIEAIARLKARIR